MVSEKTRALLRAQIPCGDKRKRVLCDDLNCKPCHNSSFESVLDKIPNIEIVDNNIDPRKIQKYSQKELLFKCNVCLHTFNKKIMGFTTGEYCIYCTTKPIKLCDKGDCKFCSEKSFASHQKSKCWDYDKNEVTPRQVYKNSTEKYFFVCDKCNHSFDTTPKILSLGCDCPYCAGSKLCGNENCEKCFNKSFATHLFAVNWSKKNDVLPWQVCKGSTSKKYYFNCKNCHHELYMVLCSLDENTLNCLYCTGKERCDKNCGTCFNKSFASHEKSKFWSKNNKVFPREVSKFTNDKYYFDCDRCKNNFQMQISNITANNQWCPACVNKTEMKLRDWLYEKYGDENIKTQYKFEHENGTYFYDFYIQQFNILIELDGLQHFKQVAKWKTPEHNLKNDINKIVLALENEKTIIHLLQEDVLHDRNNWEKKLVKCIKQYNEPSAIYINNNDIYKNHIDGINKLI